MRIWIIELKQKIDTKWTGTFQLFVLLSLWLKNGEQSILKIFKQKVTIKILYNKWMRSQFKQILICVWYVKILEMGLIGVFSTMVRFITIIVRHVWIIWIKKPGDLCPLCDSPIDLKVIREKSRGEGSLIVQDTIENVSEPKFFFKLFKKKKYIF